MALPTWPDAPAFWRLHPPVTPSTANSENTGSPPAADADALPLGAAPADGSASKYAAGSW